MSDTNNTKKINAQTGGQTPNANPPSGNQQPPKQSGGGPEGVAKVNPAIDAAVKPPTATVGTAVPNNDNIDIDKMIASGIAETQTLDADIQARKDKTEYLSKALEARTNFEQIPYHNVETGEIIGTRIRYLPDTDGKTIYDYMNEEAVKEHIVFVAAEGDPTDGSPVDRQVTYFWAKPTY